MRRLCMPAVLLFAMTAAAAAALANDVCLECHEKKTPGIVTYWRESAHFQKKVGCADCHGNDIDAVHSGKSVVDAARCGSCHKGALAEHRKSKHGIAGRAGSACTRNLTQTAEVKKGCSRCHDAQSSIPEVKAECARFLVQTPEMQRQGCSSCHSVETRCDSCHTKHGTDLALLRDPGTCGTCHMGPDHPQAETWDTSRHGALYKQKGPGTAPACVTCHMQAGSHNVSRGISSGSQDKEREFMLAICSQCHTRDFSARDLADADAIRAQSDALVQEAQRIIEGLDKDGLLAPSPANRPAHPLFGKTLVLGPQMLYENLSSVEALFFNMKKFYAPTAYKSVYHQNPDYAHWYGNAPLKLTLSEIKSQAMLLRKIDALEKRIDNLGLKSTGEGSKAIEDLKAKLRDLKEQRLKEEITEPEYQKRKNDLLDKKGL